MLTAYKDIVDNQKLVIMAQRSVDFTLIFLVNSLNVYVGDAEWRRQSEWTFRDCYG